MRARQQVVWQQGLLLKPQHFQLQDLAHQGLLAPVYRFALPFFWGVAELSLDEAALAEGAVVVSEGSFLFQDGSYAVLGANAVLEGRVLAGAWPEGGRLTVYLGLRRWSDTGPNVALGGDSPLSGLAARLVASPEPEPVCDLHTGGPAAQIRRQSFLLRLFFESEAAQLGDYHLIPIALLERAGGGARLLDYVPPLLTIAASPRLAARLAQLRTLLGDRQRELARRCCSVAAGASLTLAELPLLLAQHSLSRYLPVLDRLLETPASHPRELFLALSQLAGELSACSSWGGAGRGEGPPVPYDHRDMLRCFEAARAAVQRLLDEIMAAPDHVVPFQRAGDLFCADLEGRCLAPGGRYFLALKSACDPLVLLGALQTAVKASTREHLKLLTARALPGIGLSHAPIPPAGVAPRLHTLYLELDQAHEQWALVRAERNLALSWDNSPADLEMELIALGAEGGV